jgi:hypothetical protein
MRITQAMRKADPILLKDTWHGLGERCGAEMPASARLWSAALALKRGTSAFLDDTRHRGACCGGGDRPLHCALYTLDIAPVRSQEFLKLLHIRRILLYLFTELHCQSTTSNHHFTPHNHHHGRQEAARLRPRRRHDEVHQASRQGRLPGARFRGRCQGYAGRTHQLRRR